MQDDSCCGRIEQGIFRATTKEAKMELSILALTEVHRTNRYGTGVVIESFGE